MTALIVQELSVFLLADGCLHLVDCLFDEDTILHIENAVCVAFEFWVVRHHDASSTRKLSFSRRPDTVYVK